jgi:acetyl-CoA acyltransferase
MPRTTTSPFAAGREVLIAEAARTPFGKSHPERGWFRDTHPNTLLGNVYRELLARSGLDPIIVEDLLIGCTAPFGEQSRNIARNAWLQEGYPPEVPAVVLDRRCGSAQTAIEMGAALVASGVHDVVLAGGVEHMGHVPIDSPVKISELYGDPWPPQLRERYDFVHQGESAELIADRWDIGRVEMDEFAARSHQLAADAIAAGRFADEIIPFELDGERLSRDCGQRSGRPAGGSRPAARPRSPTAPPASCWPRGPPSRSTDCAPAPESWTRPPSASTR